MTDVVTVVEQSNVITTVVEQSAPVIATIEERVATVVLQPAVVVSVVQPPPVVVTVPIGVMGPPGLPGDGVETGPAFTYTAGRLTFITYDTGNTKSLSYTDGRLTQIDYTVGDVVKRRSFVYALDGSLSEIVETIV